MDRIKRTIGPYLYREPKWVIEALEAYIRTLEHPPMPDPTPEERVRAIARCYLAAPERSYEGDGLLHALNQACCENSLDPDAILNHARAEAPAQHSPRTDAGKDTP